MNDDLFTGPQFAPVGGPDPEGLVKVEPRIMLAVPMMDSRLDYECMMGVLQVLTISQGLVSPFIVRGNSNITHCRNVIANYFMLHTQCKTLVWVDSDIAFTAQEFQYLLHGESPVVVTPYAKKKWGDEPTELGFGFVRTDREALQALGEWLTEDGQEMMPRYRENGELNVQYFWTGAAADMRWWGEDGSFFQWCMQREIPIRKETRARLKHIGRCAYEYPEQTPVENVYRQAIRDLKEVLKQDVLREDVSEILDRFPHDNV